VFTPHHEIPGCKFGEEVFHIPEGDGQKPLTSVRGAGFTELEEKASVYFLFSRLFRKAPDLSLLKEIVETKLLTLGANFFDDSGRESNCLEELRWPEQLEEIAVEHTALFVVAGESYISPYESYHCDTLTIDPSTACSPYFEPDPLPKGMKGFIGGPSAAAVQKCYEENGFGLSPDFHDLPDHIACELELMGRFYQEGNVDKARDFFQNHLTRWVFAFLEELEKQRCSCLYQKVAVGLSQFLKEEANIHLLKIGGGSQND